MGKIARMIVNLWSRIRTRNNIPPMFWIAMAEAVAVLAIAMTALRLWRYDFRVPIAYWGDTLWFVSVVKGVVQNGWAFDIPQLSAPFTLSAAAFPSMTNFDWGLMKIIALIVPDAGIVLNLFWLFSFVLTAWAASLSLHLLGVRTWLALQGGILYAFLPFAFMRTTAHISLVYFCVPLLCLFTVSILDSRTNHVDNAVIRRLGYLACFAQGFDYIYFSFFSIILFMTAGIFAYIRQKKTDTIKHVLTAISIIIVASVFNLTPSLYSWHKFGQPGGMNYKHSAEAEVYGLKIRRMLVPHPANPLHPLRSWARKDQRSNFPIENENRTARLGLVAGVGFLLLLLVSLNNVEGTADDDSRRLRGIAALALFTLLVTTVGGFGVLINFLIGQDDIRAYNRFSVFLAFFAIAGFSIWADGCIRKVVKSFSRNVLIGCVILFSLLSLYDQLLDARPLVVRQVDDMQSAYHERTVVHRMEEQLQTGAMVFQMPHTGFPADGGLEKMLPYDHARPNLWSQNLRWSWPSFSLKHHSWLDKIDRLQGEAFVRALVLSGFDAIWVDRFGYKDAGNSIVHSLIGSGGEDLLPGLSPRYVILDLRNVREYLMKSLGNERFERESEEILGGVSMYWGDGFYEIEKNDKDEEFRWSRSESRLSINNFTSQIQDVRLSFDIQSQTNGVVNIQLGKKVIVFPSAFLSSRTQLDFRLEPGQSERVEFSTKLPRVEAPGENRDLHFIVKKLEFTNTPFPY